MSGQWKPGDVALILVGGTEHVALRDSDEAWLIGDSLAYRVLRDSETRLPSVSVIRHLVVIDPEDREQVERLIAAYSSQPRWHTGYTRDRIDAMQAALREFANPTPPKCTASLFVTYGDGKGAEQRCDRAEGHEGPHVDGSFTWTAVQS